LQLLGVVTLFSRWQGRQRKEQHTCQHCNHTRQTEPALEI
jgi:hypothetical protein